MYDREGGEVDDIMSEDGTWRDRVVRVRNQIEGVNRGTLWNTRYNTSKMTFSTTQKKESKLKSIASIQDLEVSVRL